MVDSGYRVFPSSRASTCPGRVGMRTEINVHLGEAGT